MTPLGAVETQELVVRRAARAVVRSKGWTEGSRPRDHHDPAQTMAPTRREASIHMLKSRTGPRRPLSVLTLRFDVVDERPDWPVVTVLVDGTDPVGRHSRSGAVSEPAWRGFSPGAVLGDASPLLPVDLGRRVAVCCCSCGYAGCGAIAPLVIPSPDGRRVSWVDFRAFGAEFEGPLRATENYDGAPCGLDEVHFDRAQYVAEIQRASHDLSWETPRRRAARLLRERLEPEALVLPPGLTLQLVIPARSGMGVALLFRPIVPAMQREVRDRWLELHSAADDPARASQDVARQLLSTDPRDWLREFGRADWW